MNKKIRFWWYCYAIIALIFAIAALVTCQHQPSLHTLSHPRADAHGQSLTFSDFKGKWVVVNYWATWCKPCHQEIPELNQLQIAQKGSLIVLGVSFDDLSNKKIKQYAKKNHINYRVVGQLPLIDLGIKPVKALPATLIFDPQGHLFSTLYGHISKGDIEKIIFGAK